MAAKRKKVAKKASRGIRKGRKKAAQTVRSKRDRWKARFLEALKEQGAVTTACQMAGVGRRTAYTAREDLEFAAEWDTAVDAMVDGVEDAIIHRARYGHLEPVIYQGVLAKDEDGEPLCIRKWDTTLQIFVTRQKRPEQWARAEKLKVEHEGKVTFTVLTHIPLPDEKED